MRSIMARFVGALALCSALSLGVRGEESRASDPLGRHDPDWHAAVISVERVLKNRPKRALEDGTLTLYFPAEPEGAFRSRAEASDANARHLSHPRAR